MDQSSKKPKEIPKPTAIQASEAGQARVVWASDIAVSKINASAESPEALKVVAPIIHKAAKACTNEEFYYLMMGSVNELPKIFTEEELNLLKNTFKVA